MASKLNSYVKDPVGASAGRGTQRRSRIWPRTAPALAVLALAAAQFHVGRVRAEPSGVDATTAASCVALQQLDFAGLQDAPTKVTSAAVVAPVEGAPAYCKVDGTIDPHVGYEIRLPISGWNGKLIAVGNIGWGGLVNAFACDAYLRRGYACVATDTGHKGDANHQAWAADNLPAQVDFAFRAVHVGSLAAKAIVSRYYAKPPRKSYFVGCSTGGYEGLVEAQKFPWDFDGIIAGAPDMDEADLTMRAIWAHRAMFDAAGKPLLDASALAFLHRAALASCDLDDGVRDGLIGNPLACTVDPAKLLCPKGKAQDCLTADQVSAARKIYNGPPAPAGRPGVRGALPGSELAWPAGFGADSMDDATGLFEHMIYGASPGWTAANYDFTRDYRRLGLAALYSDTDPDLRQFKAAGGKLIVYQGATDVIEQPTAIVDYYQTVEKVMGDPGSTKDFFRLFVVPGTNHCVGGSGAYTIDYLGYLEAWAEENKAPDVLVGAHVSDAYLAALPLPARLALMAAILPPERRTAIVSLLLPLPLDPKVPVGFSRPIYPYPSFATFRSGDPNQAASFGPAQP